MGGVEVGLVGVVAANADVDGLDGVVGFRMGGMGTSVPDFVRCGMIGAGGGSVAR